MSTELKESTRTNFEVFVRRAQRAVNRFKECTKPVTFLRFDVNSTTEQMVEAIKQELNKIKGNQ